jgi:hypothetical protein
MDLREKRKKNLFLYPSTWIIGARRRSAESKREESLELKGPTVRFTIPNSLCRGTHDYAKYEKRGKQHQLRSLNLKPTC